MSIVRGVAPPVLLLFASAACSDWEDTSEASSGGSGAGGTSSSGGTGAGASDSKCDAPPGPSADQLPLPVPMGLHAVGNTIQDRDGNVIKLRGVNRSGSEYACVSATGGVFDGPATEESVRALASWPINAVRVPLNEACWLGINGVPTAATSASYKAAIKDYVLLLQKYGLVPILDLHWAVAGNEVPRSLLPLPNADHTPDFWTDVANTFLDNDGVVFELYNEPYWNGTSTAPPWECWRDGCLLTGVRDEHRVSHPDYQTAGMQQLVQAVRDTGAKNLILVGGLQFSNDLSQWLAHAPSDPLGNLGATWHVYNFNACLRSTCSSAAPEAVAAVVPLVATEVGEDDCTGELVVKPLVEFLDANSSGYLAWSWSAFSMCVPTIRENGRTVTAGQPWSLVTSYTCPLPNGGYAQAFYDHLKSLVP